LSYNSTSSIPLTSLSRSCLNSLITNTTNTSRSVTAFFFHSFRASFIVPLLGFFFWAGCCGLQQITTNYTIAAVVYSCHRNIRNSHKAKYYASPTLLKQYTPYNFTNMALYFINRALFYSPLLEL
jgi:hypothetical protein